MGAGGGPQELFRELKPRMDAPLCRTSGGRPASDQPDPALAESKHSGRWGDPRERGGHSTRGFDQRIAETLCLFGLDLSDDPVLRPEPSSDKRNETGLSQDQTAEQQHSFALPGIPQKKPQERCAE